MKHIAEYFPKPSSPCHCLNIRRASRAVTKFYEKVLEPSGLKAPQYSLLEHLKYVGPITISELAKIMRIDRTTLNRNLKPLIEADLISVYRGEVPRTREVVLTENGKSAIAKADVLWNEAQGMLGEYMGQELANFEKLLSKLEALVP